MHQRLPESPDPAADSAAATWAPLRGFIAGEARLGAAFDARGLVAAGIYEFLRFGVKQGWACLFGGIMLALLLATHFWYPRGAPLTRYDFLFLAALVVQAALLALRLETFEEAKVIFTYHVVGTVMEIFKTGVGSWIYPEPSLFHIGGVPLFAGFMYACVGSYICRSWRLFHFRFVRHPPLAALGLLSLAIYVNFFAHHYLPDARLVLFAAALVLFARTRLYFLVWRTPRWMPLMVGLVLVAVFIWIAENIGTFTRTWSYPAQRDGWVLVGWQKLGSWLLLLIISYTLVAFIKRADIKGPEARTPAQSGRGQSGSRAGRAGRRREKP